MLINMKHTLLTAFFRAHGVLLTLFVLLMVLIIAAGLLTTVQLAQQNQDVRSQAATSDHVQFDFSTTAVGFMPNEEGTVDVVANTNGLSMSAAVLVFKFDPTYVTITAIKPAAIFSQVLEPAFIDNAHGVAAITLGAKPGALVNGQAVSIAGITIKANSTPTTYTRLDFDSTKTQATAISYDSNVAVTGSQLSMSIAPSSCTPTITFPTENDQIFPDQPRLTYTGCTGVSFYQLGISGGSIQWTGQPTQQATLFSSGLTFEKNTQYTMTLQACADPDCTQSLGQTSRTFYYQEKTPAATATPVATAEPTATPAQTEHPSLDLTFRLQGLEKAGVTIPTVISVAYTDGTTPTVHSYQADFQSKADGTLGTSAPLKFGDINLPTSGSISDVVIYAKTTTSLEKRLGTVTLSTDATNHLYSTVELPVGDFERSDGEVNVIKLNDIAKALTEFKTLDNPVTDDNYEYDVDYNDTYNLQDLSIVLLNFNKLEYPGDSP